MERHRHRYEVNNQYIEILEEAGLKVAGRSADKFGRDDRVCRPSLVCCQPVPSRVHFLSKRWTPVIYEFYRGRSCLPNWKVIKVLS